MTLLTIVYFLFCLLTFILMTLDWKKDFGYVSRGNVIAFFLLSLVPVANLGVFLAASVSLVGSTKFMQKKLF